MMLFLSMISLKKNKLLVVHCGGVERVNDVNYVKALNFGIANSWSIFTIYGILTSLSTYKNKIANSW